MSADTSWFTIGLSGHRTLPDANDATLRSEASRVFRTVREAVSQRREKLQCRCLCGLAAGADLMLAETALDEGWRLTAVLPFPCAEFEGDFAEDRESLARFRSLLARAREAIELDGARESGAKPYVELGDYLVARSDLLMVVWDGRPAKGPGGTGCVVELALARGTPVAVLQAAGPVSVRWRGTAENTAGAVQQAFSARSARTTTSILEQGPGHV